MPNHGEGVEGRVRVLFLKVQLVLLDRANRVAQQLIELGACHARLPLVNIGHKAVSTLEGSNSKSLKSGWQS